MLLKIITNFFIRPIILHTERRTDNITVIHVNKEDIHKLLFINSSHVYYFGKQQVVKGKTCEGFLCAQHLRTLSALQIVKVQKLRHVDVLIKGRIFF